MKIAAFVAASVALCADVAQAALPAAMGEDTLEVRVVAADGRTPAPDVFVVGREFVSVPQFHGSKTYCFRGDIEGGARESHTLRLPGVGLADLGLLDRRDRRLETFAYAPGQCFERAESILRSKGTQPPEERLLYLLNFAGALRCADPHWSARTAANLASLSAAMLAEARSIARDKYERHLVDELRGRLTLAESFLAKQSEDSFVASLHVISQPFARDFVMARADARVSWQPPPQSPGAAPIAKRPPIVVVATPGSVQAMAVSPGGVVRQAGPAQDPGASRRVIHCRNGAVSACDLDERDGQGRTAIAVAAGDLDVEAVQLLLEAGANPAAPNDVSGAAALEALVHRMVSRPPAAGPEQEHARAIVALFAASPKASLLQSMRDDLTADPATWLPTLSAKPLLIEARDAWRNVPTRPDAHPACEPIERVIDYSTTPRIRMPR